MNIDKYLAGKTPTAVPSAFLPVVKFAKGGKFAGVYIRRVTNPDAPAGVPKVSYIFKAEAWDSGVTFQKKRAPVNISENEFVSISGASFEAYLTPDLEGKRLLVTLEGELASTKGNPQKDYRVSVLS